MGNTENWEHMKNREIGRIRMVGKIKKIAELIVLELVAKNLTASYTFSFFDKAIKVNVKDFVDYG